MERRNAALCLLLGILLIDVRMPPAVIQRPSTPAMEPTEVARLAWRYVQHRPSRRAALNMCNDLPPYDSGLMARADDVDKPVIMTLFKACI